MPDARGRRRAVAVALVAAGLFASILPSVRALAAAPPGLEPFLGALGEIESGGSYTARNAVTGAYGKYQILPSNWPAWASLYLGSSTAAQTPANQETVAHRKVTALYAWLDSWSVVAHWWLTGSSERNAALWSSYSRTYVDRVISLMKASSGDVAGAIQRSSTSWIDAADRRISDSALAIHYSSGWKSASYSSYSRGHVRYATAKGATATFTFSGTGIAWYGPVGPTRGVARVFVDGIARATVDLRRSSFGARRLLYARPLAAGEHTLKIVVLSSGRPVAIDDLLVGT